MANPLNMSMKVQNPNPSRTQSITLMTLTAYAYDNSYPYHQRALEILNSLRDKGLVDDSQIEKARKKESETLDKKVQEEEAESALTLADGTELTRKELNTPELLDVIKANKNNLNFLPIFQFIDQENIGDFVSSDAPQIRKLIAQKIPVDKLMFFSKEEVDTVLDEVVKRIPAIDGENLLVTNKNLNENQKSILQLKSDKLNDLVGEINNGTMDTDEKKDDIFEELNTLEGSDFNFVTRVLKNTFEEEDYDVADLIKRIDPNKLKDMFINEFEHDPLFALEVSDIDRELKSNQVRAFMTDDGSIFDNEEYARNYGGVSTPVEIDKNEIMDLTNSDHRKKIVDEFGEKVLDDISPNDILPSAFDISKNEDLEMVAKALGFNGVAKSEGDFLPIKFQLFDNSIAKEVEPDFPIEDSLFRKENFTNSFREMAQNNYEGLLQIAIEFSKEKNELLNKNSNTKSEMLDYLRPDDATVFINDDDPIVREKVTEKMDSKKAKDYIDDFEDEKSENYTEKGFANILSNVSDTKELRKFSLDKREAIREIVADKLGEKDSLDMFTKELDTFKADADSKILSTYLSKLSNESLKKLDLNSVLEKYGDNDKVVDAILKNLTADKLGGENFNAIENLITPNTSVEILKQLASVVDETNIDKFTGDNFISILNDKSDEYGKKENPSTPRSPETNKIRIDKTKNTKSYADIKGIDSNKEITIYRATVPGGKIEVGDFVTSDREVAKFYARDIVGQRGEPEVKIVKRKVKAGEIKLHPNHQEQGIDNEFIYNPLEKGQNGGEENNDLNYFTQTLFPKMEAVDVNKFIDTFGEKINIDTYRDLIDNSNFKKQFNNAEELVKFTDSFLKNKENELINEPNTDFLDKLFDTLPKEKHIDYVDNKSGIVRQSVAKTIDKSLLHLMANDDYEGVRDVLYEKMKFEDVIKIFLAKDIDKDRLPVLRQRIADELLRGSVNPDLYAVFAQSKDKTISDIAKQINFNNNKSIIKAAKILNSNEDLKKIEDENELKEIDKVIVADKIEKENEKRIERKDKVSKDLKEIFNLNDDEVKSTVDVVDSVAESMTNTGIYKSPEDYYNSLPEFRKANDKKNIERSKELSKIVPDGKTVKLSNKMYDDSIESSDVDDNVPVELFQLSEPDVKTIKKLEKLGISDSWSQYLILKNPTLLSGYKNKEELNKKLSVELDSVINKANEGAYSVTEDSNAVTRVIQNDYDVMLAEGRNISAGEIQRNLDNETLRREVIAIHAKTQKEETDKWVNYLKGQKDYSADFKLALMNEILTKNYDIKTDKVTKRTNKTLRNISNLNQAAVAELSKKDLIETDLIKAYILEVNKQQQSELSNLRNVKDTKDGKWVTFKSKSSDPTNYEDNISKLSTLVQDTPWCTKSNARSQLAGGDFHVFITEKDGKSYPRIAVRMEGDRIGEMRGILAGQQVEEEMLPHAEEYLSKDVKGGEKWLGNVKYNKRLQTVNEKFNTDNITIDDISDIEQSFIDHTKFHVEYEENAFINTLKDNIYKNSGKLKTLIAEKYNINADNIVLTSYENFEREGGSVDEIEYSMVDLNYNFATSINLKFTTGNVNLSHSRITSLEKLKTIGGELNCAFSKLENLGELEYIGGDALFENSAMKSFRDLREIGGTLYLRHSNLIDLGKLNSIGGNVAFLDSKIKSLGELERIGGFADFKYSKIELIGKLQTIGDSATFSNSKIENLGNLKSIGGYAAFYDSLITDLGNLEYIGDYVYFEKTNVETLGNLKYIGNDVNFSKSKIKSLGNLEHIGTNAYFQGSLIESLDKLKFIGGEAHFENSNVKNLGDLESIGSDANFMNSKIENLDKLKSIGGDSIFYESKIKSLGELKSIGGDANFNDVMTLESLGNLETIGGKGKFNRTKIELGNLKSIGEDARFHDAQITSLGNLETVGGSLYITDSEITSLGKLQSIGDAVSFNNSKIENLGELKSIGGEAYFNNSNIKSLGNLETIGGLVEFTDSNVKDLGKLRSIGGYVYFTNSKIESLGNLQYIGGIANFSNSQVENLGDLQSIDGGAHFSNSKIVDLGKLESIRGFAYFTNSKIKTLGNLQYIGGDVAGFMDSPYKEQLKEDYQKIKNNKPLQQGSKGSVDVKNRILTAFEGADVSTPVHELSHIWFDDIKNAVESGNKIATNLYNSITDFASSEEGLKFWKRYNKDRDFEPENYEHQQELFARGFEKYLADGEAPTEKLKGVFDNFKKWMKNIYVSLIRSDIDINLSDNMKKVYATLLGSDDALKEFTEKAKDKSIDVENIMQSNIEEPPPVEEVTWNNGDTTSILEDKVDMSTLEKINTGGSSRNVYLLPGGDKVVKVAKNPRGLEQNDMERPDYLIQEWLPEFFESGNDYVVAEYVPRNDKAVKKFLEPLKKFNAKDFEEQNSELQNVMRELGLDDFLSYDIWWGDFTAYRNWGMTNDGKFKLVDMGALNSKIHNSSKISDQAFKDWNSIKSRRNYVKKEREKARLKKIVAEQEQYRKEYEDKRNNENEIKRQKQLGKISDLNKEIDDINSQISEIENDTNLNKYQRDDKINLLGIERAELKSYIHNHPLNNFKEINRFKTDIDLAMKSAADTGNENHIVDVIRKLRETGSSKLTFLSNKLSSIVQSTLSSQNKRKLILEKINETYDNLLENNLDSVLENYIDELENIEGITMDDLGDVVRPLMEFFNVRYSGDMKADAKKLIERAKSTIKADRTYKDLVKSEQEIKITPMTPTKDLNIYKLPLKDFYKIGDYYEKMRTMINFTKGTDTENIQVQTSIKTDMFNNIKDNSLSTFMIMAGDLDHYIGLIETSQLLKNLNIVDDTIELFAPEDKTEKQIKKMFNDKLKQIKKFENYSFEKTRNEIKNNLTEHFSKLQEKENNIQAKVLELTKDGFFGSTPGETKEKVRKINRLKLESMLEDDVENLNINDEHSLKYTILGENEDEPNVNYTMNMIGKLIDKMPNKDEIMKSLSIALPTSDYDRIRAGYVERNGTILLSKFKEATLIHEFGHHLESSDQGIFNAVTEFYLKRTYNDKIQRLAEVTGVNFGFNETFKKDNFIEDYTGKVYVSGDKLTSTEIVSTGLQYLYEDPIQFYNKDPEHYMLIKNILEGKYNSGKPKDINYSGVASENIKPEKVNLPETKEFVRRLLDYGGTQNISDNMSVTLTKQSFGIYSLRLDLENEHRSIYLNFNNEREVLKYFKNANKISNTIVGKKLKSQKVDTLPVIKELKKDSLYEKDGIKYFVIGKTDKGVKVGILTNKNLILKQELTINNKDFEKDFSGVEIEELSDDDKRSKPIYDTLPNVDDLKINQELYIPYYDDNIKIVDNDNRNIVGEQTVDDDKRNVFIDSVEYNSYNPMIENANKWIDIKINKTTEENDFDNVKISKYIKIGLRTANQNFYVIDDKDKKVGVFKPALQENPTLSAAQFNMPPGQAYIREVVAFKVNQLFGFDDIVPTTIIKNINGKIGSMQKFVDSVGSLSKYQMDNDINNYDLLLDGFDKDNLSKAYLLDYLLESQDRHMNNYMVTKDKKLVAIDNGYSMGTEHDDIEFRQMSSSLLYNQIKENNTVDYSKFEDNILNKLTDVELLQELQTSFFNKRLINPLSFNRFLSRIYSFGLNKFKLGEIDKEILLKNSFTSFTTKQLLEKIKKLT